MMTPLDNVDMPGSTEDPLDQAGQLSLSAARLLDLPAEILDQIVDLLSDDKGAVATLSLVNSAFRRLARPLQFSHVSFNAKPTSFHLIAHLIQSLKTGQVETSIGPLIRQLTLRIFDRSHFLNAPFDLAEIHGHGKSQAHPLEEHAACYQKCVLEAIETAMPNLKAVNWRFYQPIGVDFFRILCNSQIHDLRLYWDELEEPWLLQPPLTPSEMTLRSLYLDVGSISIHGGARSRTEYAVAETRSTGPVIASLLERCSASLESLQLNFHIHWLWPSTISVASTAFPHLRHFGLSAARHNEMEGVYQVRTPTMDEASYLSILKAPLRSFVLPNISEDAALSLAISKCGVLRDLETAVFEHPSTNEGAERITDFVAKNRTIRHLHFMPVPYLAVDTGQPEISPQAMPSTLLLPALASGGFDNLRSLTLYWIGPLIKRLLIKVPPSLFALIGTLESLEEVRLTVGSAVGWCRGWLPEHDEIRANLRPLTKLKRLAFCNDAYGSQPSSYYPTVNYQPDPPDGPQRPELDIGPEPAGFQGDRAIDMDSQPGQLGEWERAHRNCMLEEGERYAYFLPSLEWMFLGGRRMSIQDAADSGPRVAVPLTRQRMRLETDFYNWAETTWDSDGMLRLQRRESLMGVTFRPDPLITVRHMHRRGWRSGVP